MRRKIAGLYAMFQPSSGLIRPPVCMKKKLPSRSVTLSALAQGTKPWKDPKTGAMGRGVRLYEKR